MRKNPWFAIGMTSVLLLSLSLHFWGLERFNTLVFDEVYYVKFANNYLNGKPLFDAHPPLGKYAIALAISIGRHLPFGRDTVNGFSGVLLSTFSYRWLNALTGSLLPLVVGAIAYQLSYRRGFALIAALLTTVDGLFLVESRYALINIYLVFFGLLGHWLFLLALDCKRHWRWLWLALSGTFFGASASVKWNGLGFLFGIYLVLILAWVIRWASANKKLGEPKSRKKLNSLYNSTPLQKITQLNLGQILLNLCIVPALVYSLIWIPHLQINSEMGFLQLHQQLLGFHQGMGSGTDVHPYCSKWYTWPLMLRPMVYLYETARDTKEAIPLLPPLPPGTGKVIYDIHAMGNPVLWWLSTAAVLLLLTMLFLRLYAWMDMRSKMISDNRIYFPQPKEFWIAGYLILNYAANFLPWIRVNRCTFIYLYMGAAIFAFLSLAWLLERWLWSDRPQLRAMGITAIFIIILVFGFLLPVYLGLPLSSEAFQSRMWFRTWI